ncbi:MAG: YggS family pyridoxal phosphate-dependent enzyme [candidate division Zixibacteria bacterium]|nr:YggS family pyridoxal phosphate-dependent enzyme [candidate division Zixibacteria bacterium]
MVTYEEFTQRLSQIKANIAGACTVSGRSADDVTIVAVTKTFPASAIAMAVDAGLTNIGESKVQEAEPKIQELGPIARFHLIGHLQSNKAKKAVQIFDMVQSVDSIRLAEEINRRAGEVGKRIDCLIEINSSGEAQKYGMSPEETERCIETISKLPNIMLRGLMTIGPLSDDVNLIRSAFNLTSSLFAHGKEQAGSRFDTLSMGMSGDYQIAIEEGSTMIRLGSILFGSRIKA